MGTRWAATGGTGASTTTHPSPERDPRPVRHGPAGNGNGQFNQPRGIALGPDGSYYVVDTSNMRIQKFDNDGKFLSALGSEGTGDGQFTGLTSTPHAGTGPGGIAVDSRATSTWPTPGTTASRSSTATASS